ncbi:MAG: hypothetical protein KAS32_24335 [Candidatus Peribacteraceae bacterium]|nr:hypothetical protein [Candidatus Peribacteraceae bacterium]
MEHRERELFKAHLKYASDIVASWPKWKQSVMGQINRKPKKRETITYRECPYCGTVSLENNCPHCGSSTIIHYGEKLD